MKAEILSIARNCEPHITITKISPVDNTVVIEVPEGDEKPYGCSSGYFRRLDAVTQKMTPNEVRLLFRDSSVAALYEERIHDDVSWDDISEEKIKTFFSEAGIAIDKINPKDVLTSLRLATKDGIKNAGVLFFASRPLHHILQCETILVAFKGTDRVDILDRKDIQDDLWTQYQEAIIFLKRHLSIRTEIKGVDRQDYYEIPMEALREAVANAIIHRDYSFRGTSIMVEVHDDRVVIQNPGGFPAGMSRDKLGVLSVRRNELIADIFARMHRMERMGSGFKRIRKSMADAGLPFPKITSDSFFFIEFERPRKTGATVEKMSGKIVQLMLERPDITIPEIAKHLKRTERTVERLINKLKANETIRRIGPDKGGHWEIIESRQ